LPNIGPYIYEVSISGFTRSSIYIYEISSLRVNIQTYSVAFQSDSCLSSADAGIPGVQPAPIGNAQCDLHESYPTHFQRNNLRHTTQRTQTKTCTQNPSPSNSTYGGSISISLPQTTFSLIFAIVATNNGLVLRHSP